MVNLCETLAIAFKQRQKPQAMVRGKYDSLVANAVLSAEEMELALRSARRKNLDIESVLLDEFQVKPQAIGEALSAFFGVPYEPFKPDRIKPHGPAAQPEARLPREQPVGAAGRQQGRPDRGHHRPRAGAGLAHRQQHLSQGRVPSTACAPAASSSPRSTVLRRRRGDSSSIGDLLSGMDEESDEEGGGAAAGNDEVSLAADNELVQAGQQDHRRRLQPGRLGHPHRALPRQGQDRDPLPQGRHAAALHLGAGELPQRRSWRA